MIVSRGMFHHDNARPHCSATTSRYITLVCPIGGLKFKRTSVRYTGSVCTTGESTPPPPPPPPPQRVTQLLTALQHGRLNITRRVVQRLIASMCRRCQVVIRARGGHNRYRHFGHPCVTPYAWVHVSGGLPEILFRTSTEDSNLISMAS